MVLELKQVDPSPPTYFAPPELDTEENVRLLAAEIRRHRTVVELLEAIPAVAFILNPQRQIVGCNTRALEALGLQDLAGVLGKRPGELLGCIRVAESPSGCGTGQACLTCGAGTAIVESQDTASRITKECRVSIDCGRFEARDFEVVATPLYFGNRVLTVCSMKDISSEKRRKVLERVFFHDVMNTAGGIRGIASVLAEEGFEVDEEGELRSMMVNLADDLIEEIAQQRQLLAAERGDLEVEENAVSALRITEDVIALMRSHQVARGRGLALDKPESDICFLTDPVLLRRVLINMVKNALEACSPGDQVTVSVRSAGDQVSFEVNNPGVMPEEVRLQIFNRSFSTKEGVGRGIGTYSMKLLGEQYLGGRVDFVSEKPTGTTFRIVLPIKKVPEE